MAQQKRDLSRVIELFFESGHLARVQRSGFVHLGDFKQSIAEHTNRMLFISLIMAKILGADEEKVLKMCLFHDLPEARCGDHNYLQQKYDTRDEKRALVDALKNIPGKDEILSIYEEFERSETNEAMIVRDADQLELLLSLKLFIENGCKKAETWIPNLIKRLKTELGKDLAQRILETSSDSWWYKNKNDKCWINPGNKKRR